MIFVSATQFQVYLYRGLTPVLKSAFELGEGPIMGLLRKGSLQALLLILKATLETPHTLEASTS